MAAAEARLAELRRRGVEQLPEPPSAGTVSDAVAVPHALVSSGTLAPSVGNATAPSAAPAAACVGLTAALAACLSMGAFESYVFPNFVSSFFLLILIYKSILPPFFLIFFCLFFLFFSFFFSHF